MRFHGEAPSVGANRDQAIEIRAVDGRVVLSETADYGWMGVSIAVLVSGRNHGERRVHRAQELFGAGGAASVVGYFQNVGGQQIAGLNHLALDGPFDVAA